MRPQESICKPDPQAGSIESRWPAPRFTSDVGMAPTKHMIMRRYRHGKSFRDIKTRSRWHPSISHADACNCPSLVAHRIRIRFWMALITFQCQDPFCIAKIPPQRLSHQVRHFQTDQSLLPATSDSGRFGGLWIVPAPERRRVLLVIWRKTALSQGGNKFCQAPGLPSSDRHASACTETSFLPSPNNNTATFQST